MKIFTIDRYYTNNGDFKHDKGKNKYYGATLGILKMQGVKMSPLFTIERPLFYNGLSNKRDNKETGVNDSCCIPAGEYFIELTYSPTFKRDLYLVKDVINRDGIRIHPANHINDLLGCIGIGLRIIKDVKMEGSYFDYIIGESRLAVDKFELITKKEKCKLIIRDDQEFSKHLLMQYIKL